MDGTGDGRQGGKQALRQVELRSKEPARKESNHNQLHQTVEDPVQA